MRVLAVSPDQRGRASKVLLMTHGETRWRGSVRLANPFQPKFLKFFLITDYPQPRNDGTNQEHCGCFCEFERWRATRSSFKRASVRLSLPVCTEPRISAARDRKS